MRYHLVKLFFTCVFLFFLKPFSFAQTNRLDILRKVFNNARSTEEKKQAVLSICDQFTSLSADSLQRYVEIGQQLFSKESKGYLQMLNYLSISLYKAGKITEGLALGDSLIQHAVDTKNIDSVGLEIMSIHCGGLVRNGQSKEAIQQAFNMLQYAEPVKDSLGIVKAYTLLGWANMELEQYPTAIKWLNKATLYCQKNPGLISKACVVYANNASSYNNIGKADSAFYFIQLALDCSRQNENLVCLANSLNIRADMFINKKDYAGAEKDMKEALDVRQLIGEPIMIISDMAQLSMFYASTGQTVKGIDLAKKGIGLAQNINNINKLIFLYSALGENYHKSNQLDEYNATLKNIIRLKDSLYKKNSSDAIAEMEAKYNLQKQQNIIITQNYALTRSRYLSIGSSLLFLLGLLLIWALYRNYRLSQKRKMEFAVAEQKLLSNKAVELARESERKRIAADLHDNLGSYAAAITANVKYLREKQGTEDDVIMAQLDTNAQSMVTQLSDTIWVLKNEYLPFTGLADRFKLWMLKLMQNYPHIKYNYNENIVKDIEFTPGRILHIFLMLKECVNNAVKHSNCTELKIDFFSNDTWRIGIEDNGRGFESTYISKGSGIDNIKNRASESGWIVEWQ
ncbi:MAG: histidine kinase, partial [Ferruginibacter sp.]